jgi:predicted extracellular nuclease
MFRFSTITHLTAKIEYNGYINLDQQFGGSDAYSYLFGGQSGTLDYAFTSPSLNPFITGAAPWHINADEPTVLDYSTAFKSPNQIASLYAPDAYASSDHDPVLVGLKLKTVPEPGSILGLFAIGLLGLGSKQKQNTFLRGSKKRDN